MHKILFFTVPEVELSVSNSDNGHSKAGSRFWFHIPFFAFLHALHERGFPAPI